MLDLKDFCFMLEEERALGSSVELEEFCSILSKVMLRAVGVDVSIIMFFDAKDREMVAIAGMGVTKELVYGLRLDAEKPPFHRILQGDDSVVVEAANDEHFIPKINPRWRRGYLFILALRWKEELVGVLNLYKRDGQFDEETKRALGPVCRYVATLIKAYEKGNFARWKKRTRRITLQIRQAEQLRKATERIRSDIEEVARRIALAKRKDELMREVSRLEKNTEELERNIDLLKAQAKDLEKEIERLEGLIKRVRETRELLKQRDRLAQEVEELKRQVSSSNQLLYQAKRIDELSRTKKELSLLYDITRETYTFNETGGLLARVLSRIQPFFDYELGAYLVVENGHYVAHAKSKGIISQATIDDLQKKIQEDFNILGYQVGSISVRVENPATISRRERPPKPILSSLTTPLLDEGDLIGGLNISSFRENAFDQSMERVFKLLSTHLSLAISKIRLLKQTRRELKEAQAKLVRSAKMAAMGEITSKVSHELKGPLGRVSMAVSSMKKEEDPSILKEYIEILERASTQANRIVRDILSFSKSINLELSLLDINKVIEEAILICEHELKKSKVTLSLQLDKDPPKIPGDPSRLEEVFVNLITNASQAMHGGGTLTISSKVVGGGLEEGGRIEIRFKDTGCGIGEEEMRHLFDLFWTTKSDGLGLGLVISKEIIEKHNGRITVESKKGMGSTFTVSLPLS